MKRIRNWIGSGGAALMLLLATGGFAQMPGDNIILKGEVVDLWCYLKDGSHGPDHKECAQACAKAGNPIGLVINTGAIYLLLSSKEHQSVRDELLDKLGTMVMVEGQVYKRTGMTAVYITNVTPYRPVGSQ